MLSGIESEANVNRVLADLGWSFPYTLQSLALAVSISWILDFHQSRGMSEKLEIKQRIFDVVVSIAALGVMSITAFYWMEGKGWFEGFATKELQFQNKTSFVWFVAKGMAVAAVVGWLVPMWFHMNRTKAPDQIAGRLIKMNKKGLSREIRHLEPNQLVKSVAAVSASVAAMGNNVSRNEADVYQIICGQLSGLPSSDVDIDSAKIEFEHYLKLAKNNELELEQKIKSLKHLPLLTSLLPYVATAIAFADGVYLDEERRRIEQIENIVHPEK
jgi:tellurite resistance protein